RTWLSLNRRHDNRVYFTALFSSLILRSAVALRWCPTLVDTPYSPWFSRGKEKSALAPEVFEVGRLKRAETSSLPSLFSSIERGTPPHPGNPGCFFFVAFPLHACAARYRKFFRIPVLSTVARLP